MSRTTATAARQFATAYASHGKSSVTMVNACVTLINADVSPSALVALVRGEVEKSGPLADVKGFEKLVSQRSFAASLVLIVGEEAATDPLAIKAALAVASGALPRKVTLAIAESLKGSNDAPAFDAAIRKALADKKTTPRGPNNAGGTDNSNNPGTGDKPADKPVTLAPLNFSEAVAYVFELIGKMPIEEQSKALSKVAARHIAARTILDATISEQTARVEAAKVRRAKPVKVAA